MHRPRAVVLVTGDEVVRGRVADRNGVHLAAWLDARGFRVDGVSILRDDLERIAAAIAGHIADGVELVCTSGGLGPTHDDVTMRAVADATGRALALDQTALAMVESRSRGIAAPPAAARRTRHKQATLPVGARVVPPSGTAPGCVVEHRGALVVVLPGPPWELRAMWEAATAGDPALVALLGRVPGRPERILRVHATPESELVPALEGAPGVDALALGICAKDGELELTLRGAAAPTQALVEHVAARFGERLFSRDGATLDRIIADRLRARGDTVAVAESCTAGALGARLTASEGASAFMAGGVIAYSNDVKRDVLGVAPALLERHGAVSGECARAMADGARRLVGATWALSITGIAGPGGGAPGRPVGLVHIGRAGPEGTISEEHRFRGGREEVRRRSVAAALHLLRRALIEV